MVPPGPDYADAVYNELELASKFEVLKKMEEDLRAEQELVDKSALLMKMLEVSGRQSSRNFKVNAATYTDKNDIEHINLNIKQKKTCEFKRLNSSNGV